jgi:outer membrane protein assembly factor BamB
MRRTLGGLSILLLAGVAAAADGPDALWDAARRGDAAAVRKLLDAGVDANAKTPYGATALFFAADKGHVEVVKELIRGKANVNAKDTFYNATPLTWAAMRDRAGVVRELLAAGAEGGNDILLMGARSGSIELVRAAVEGAKLTEKQLTAALTLVPEKSTEVKKLLIKAGAKPAAHGVKLDALAGTYKSDGGTAWSVAVQNGLLVVSTADRALFALWPVGPLTFEPSGDTTAALTFRKTGEAITGLEYRDGAIAVNLQKVKAPPAAPAAPAAAQADVQPPAPADDPGGVVTKPLDWPQFRGAGATGVADGQFPPVSWDVKAGRNVRWMTPIPGLAHSCPVVVGDRVYVTTAISGDPNTTFRPGQYGDVDSVDDKTEHTWKVYCLDKRTGEFVWVRTASQGVPKVKRHLKGSHANPTPAADGERVVVSLGSEGLFCYGRDGTPLWKRDLGTLDSGWFYDKDYQWGFGSSPIIYKGQVIVQCDVGKGSFLAAYDLLDGRTLWQTPREEIPSWGTPTVVDGPKGPELVTNATKFARGYDPETGKELWRLGKHSEITVPTPFMAKGLVFVTSGYRPVQPIYAIRPGGRGDISLKDGETQSEQIAWSKSRGGPYMPTPIAYGDYLYTCPNNGVIGCYEIATGKQLYSQRLPGSGGYTASPVAADGKLYFTSEEGFVCVVKAGPKYELLARNAVGEVCMATPAITDGVLFVRTQHHVIALGRPAR